MSLKIVFMGTPEFSIPTLQVLKQSKHKIVCVYTQPLKKSEVKKHLKLLSMFFLKRGNKG